METKDAPPDLIEAVAAAANVDGSILADCVIVGVKPENRNSQGWPEFIFAARFVGPEFMGDEVGTWATSYPAGALWALNSTAREYTAWAEAAQPDSRADRNMKMMADYPEARAAEAAVRARRTIG